MAGVNFAHTMIVWISERVYIYLFRPKNAITLSIDIDKNSISPYNISTKPNRQVTGLKAIINKENVILIQPKILRTGVIRNY